MSLRIAKTAAGGVFPAALAICALGLSAWAAEGPGTAAAKNVGGTHVTQAAPDTSDPFEMMELDSARASDSARAADSGLSARPRIPQGPDTAAPSLGLFPLAVQGGGVGEEERSGLEAAIRLGASLSGAYRVRTAEETARRLPKGGSYGRDCFSERCVAASSRGLGADLALASQYFRRDSVAILKLAVVETASGKLRAAMEARVRPAPDSIVPFARAAVESLMAHMADPAAAAGHGENGDDRAGKVGMAFASGAWRSVAWLNPKDSVDNRRGIGWAASGLLVAATGLAWAEGQLFQRDDNGASPQGALLDNGGPSSFLRGFFAEPTLGARYAAMGGAGIAHVNNGLALLMNPAGVAGSDHEDAVAAKRTLPDGTPSLFLAYAGPLYDKWSQGLGVQYEGDALASETTVEGALAYDLSAWGKAWDGVKAGAELKLYLADVGRSGTGLDRSTGHSFGAGLDVGLQARLSEKITAALAVRDLAGFLRHTNTFTDRNYAEVLPAEYHIGAAYQASPTLLLLLDGQKGLFADQADHVQLGAEQVAFGFLAMRCGLHQIFGREAVRKLTLGFGINTDGFGNGILKSRVALNYGYEFGLNDDEPLGGGQQFSVDVGF